MTDQHPETETTAPRERTRTPKTSRGAATKRPRGGGAGKAPKKAATPKKRAVTPAQGATRAKRSAGPATRTDTKQAKLIAMLQSPDGATIEDLVKTFGWQAHTVRGAIAGALKKKLGLDVTSEKVEGRGRVYRIAG
jgi:hypothetical protein